MLGAERPRSLLALLALALLARPALALAPPHPSPVPRVWRGGGTLVAERLRVHADSGWADESDPRWDRPVGGETRAWYVRCGAGAISASALLPLVRAPFAGRTTDVPLGFELGSLPPGDAGDAVMRCRAFDLRPDAREALASPERLLRLSRFLEEDEPVLALEFPRGERARRWITLEVRCEGCVAEEAPKPKPETKPKPPEDRSADEEKKEKKPRPGDDDDAPVDGDAAAMGRRQGARSNADADDEEEESAVREDRTASTSGDARRTTEDGGRSRTSSRAAAAAAAAGVAVAAAAAVAAGFAAAAALRKRARPPPPPPVKRKTSDHPGAIDGTSARKPTTERGGRRGRLRRRQRRVTTASSLHKKKGTPQRTLYALMGSSLPLSSDSTAHSCLRQGTPSLLAARAR